MIVLFSVEQLRSTRGLFFISGENLRKSSWGEKGPGYTCRERVDLGLPSTSDVIHHPQQLASSYFGLAEAEHSRE